MKTYHDIVTDGGSNIAHQVEAQNEHLMARLAGIDHIVAVMSGKGGVGKSMTTVLLATELARMGHRTAIVDADINGASQVQMTGVARWPEMGGDSIAPALTSAGVQVMSIDMFLSEGDPVKWDSVTDHSTFTWRGMVEVAAIREMLADTAWDNVDTLFIDLPPGTDKLPNLLDLVPTLSAAIVVSIPSRVSEYVVTKSVGIARSSFGDKPIGLIENMTEFVCDGCGKRHAMFPGGGASLADALGLPLLGQIPFDPMLSERVDSGRTFDAGTSRLAESGHTFDAGTSRLAESGSTSDSGRPLDSGRASSHALDPGAVAPPTAQAIRAAAVNLLSLIRS